MSYLKRGLTYYDNPGSYKGFNLTNLIKQILIEQELATEEEAGCCFKTKNLYIKKGLFGKKGNNIKFRILSILEDFGVDISYENCCLSNKYHVPFMLVSPIKSRDYTISLKKEIKKALDILEIPYDDPCCVEYEEILMRNFLDGETSNYPVGVFNVNGDYLGVAEDQEEYITLWNSDIDNNAQGTLLQGSSLLSFKLPNTSTIGEVLGLRYYEYTGPANMQIFVGDNDIVHYGSTIKKGNVDGISITNTTRREWDRNLYSGAFKSTLPADTVRTLTCTGYTDSSIMRVFHNEDSEYVAVSGSFGFYTITGYLPLAMKAGFWSARLVTQYNNVYNWAELTNLFSWFCLSLGGTVWGFTPSAFPTNLNKSLLTQLSVGEYTTSPGPLITDYSFITNTNFPILEDLVIVYNTGEALTTSEAWFLTMPKVTNYFRYSTQTVTQVDALVADTIWNNVATALTGITPVGAAKELRITRTNNITAASLTARNYLISQGWTVTTN